MNKADQYMFDAINDILDKGYLDENPRPKYKDGTPAHTLSVNHVTRTYDLSSGEFPICTLRPIAWKTGIRELFAIYQNQSNKVSEFEKCGCNWWKDWSLEDGTIGKSYPYNIESHRPNEVKRTVVCVERRVESEDSGKPHDDDVPLFEEYPSVDNMIYLNRYRIIGLDKERTDSKHVYYKIQFISNNYISSMRKDIIGISSGTNPYDRTVHGIGYLGEYQKVNNFTEDEILILKKKWESMLFRCYTKKREYVYDTYQDIFVHHRWHSFENFLRDVRMIPQYFLAREEDFKDWDIDKDYYGSNCYSVDTCVFLKRSENILYSSSNCYYEITDKSGAVSYEINLSEFARKINKSQQSVHKAMRKGNIFDGFTIKQIYEDDKYVYRYELSRNQVVELIKDIKNNPYGRRHIISFWNWANIDKKALVECAYETIWNVRGDFLDMCLIQRSGDMLTASGAGGINEVQYAALLMMVARHCGYEPGVFTHFVANEQIYDRHLEAAEEIQKRWNNQLIIDKTREINNIRIPQPRLVLNPEVKDFYEITIDDFTMEDYTPIKPQLKLELGI